MSFFVFVNKKHAPQRVGHVYIFQGKNDATKFYGKSMTEKLNHQRIVQKGNKVFIGTEQGFLDLKI